ncbi:hypothetical protein HOU02_gp544 [Caulobacter phage CcrBL9]|uniref:Uncharacterized protein n=1 Tax=Caulobacter phage CcrBL9 TaxID=2283270 RepID=A0A385EBB1_9CAUD|nr:hypothetical protein HOU02_gp544 [Caulobacter phage CcrBL9]AXQ69181.1 hypothetical protein CcrBL9_gp157 [Caulobacter phage CcrBL9]
MLAAATAYSQQESNHLEAVEEAHEGLILSTTTLTELCSEPLSDMGIARMSKLIAQVNQDVMLTIEAWKASKTV